MNDADLLRQYRERRSQAAFAKVMERHYGFVLALCTRELSNKTLAEDAAQSVFLILAQKASRIKVNDSLAGWLFQTSRWVCKNTRREEQRRRLREERTRAEEPVRSGNIWEAIEPYLHDGLSSLNAADREALLLRYFQGMSIDDTGTLLGVSEEAAKKRISRALDKLRTYFRRHNITLDSSGLMGLLAINCLAGRHLAPVLAPSAHAAAFAGGAIQRLTMTKLKIAIAATLVGVSAGALLCQPILRGMPTLKVIVLPDTLQMFSRTLENIPLHTGSGKAIFYGRALYGDGKPAAGILVVAQMQNYMNGQLIDLHPSQDASGWAQCVSGPDGRYALKGLLSWPYNVGIYDDQHHAWVAKAIQRITGNISHPVHVPDLIVTRGNFITGTVTDRSTGEPVMNAVIGCYGPATPETSAMILESVSDSRGHYRLRAAPGKNKVYFTELENTNEVSVDVPTSGNAIVNLTIDAIKAIKLQREKKAPITVQ
jgi:RNA polymerase sigma factor (sigma-70 family)